MLVRETDVHDEMSRVCRTWAFETARSVPSPMAVCERSSVRSVPRCRSISATTAGVVTGECERSTCLRHRDCDTRKWCSSEREFSREPIDCKYNRSSSGDPARKCSSAVTCCCIRALGFLSVNVRHDFRRAVSVDAVLGLKSLLCSKERSSVRHNNGSEAMKYHY